MELGPRIPILENVEKLVSEFSKYDQSVFSKTEDYARIINSFLSDSEKSLEFKEDGEVIIRLPSGSEGVHVLSSGRGNYLYSYQHLCSEKKATDHLF
jgi:hypothetical protein